MSNRIQQSGAFAPGYNVITDLRAKHTEMLMDFGILKLSEGMSFTDDR